MPRVHFRRHCLCSSHCPQCISHKIHSLAAIVPWSKTRVLLLISATAVVLTLTLLHFVVLPTTMGYYHQDCWLSFAKKERMHHLIRHVVQGLNEEGVTYWLDYGTLLGAVREGDIMAHDGDLDVSRLADDLGADRQMIQRLRQKLLPLGIALSHMTAKYQGEQIDMFRWQTTNSSGRPVLRVYYDFVPNDGMLTKVVNYVLPTDIPRDVLFPLRQMTVFGLQANIPHKPLDFLKIRYPLTWYMTMPYKWKCYVKSR